MLFIFLQLSKYAYGTHLQKPEQVTKYADIFSAIGTETPLRIMQLLLTAHPEGLVVGEIPEEFEIPNSTLSHHRQATQ